jgi:hypothetical protein
MLRNTTNTAGNAIGTTINKWTLASEKSLKTGPHKTMFNVKRELSTGVLKYDIYRPQGTYAGDWHNNQRDGFGTQVFSNGDKYEGGWRNDKMHGKGTYWKFVPSKGGNETRPGTSIKGHLVKVYEGEYREGKRGGAGRLYYSSLAAAEEANAKFAANAKAAAASSAGSKDPADMAGRAPSGRSVAAAKANALSGTAGLKSTLGASLAAAGLGESSLAMSTGRGGSISGGGSVHESASRASSDTAPRGSSTAGGSSSSSSSTSGGAAEARDVYEGSFSDDVPEGSGTLRYQDGAMYTGQWHNGKRHGQGVLILPNGDRYIGHWQNDMKHGPGRFLYFSRDRVYTGEWVADVARCGEMSGMTAEERASVSDTHILAAAAGGTLSALAATTAASASAVAAQSAEAARAKNIADGVEGAENWGDNFEEGTMGYGSSGVAGGPSATLINGPSPNPVAFPTLSLAAPDAVIGRAVMAARTEGGALSTAGFPDPLASASPALGTNMNLFVNMGMSLAVGDLAGAGPIGPGGVVIQGGGGALGPHGSLVASDGGADAGGAGGVGVGFGADGSIIAGSIASGGASTTLPPLYHIDASTIELLPEEVSQLTAAFRSGDTLGNGRIPPDPAVLAGVLATLGIHATEEDVTALLKELITMEREAAASSSSASGSAILQSISRSGALPGGGQISEAGPSGSISLDLPAASEGGISFPVFAVCMARLREP